MSNSAEILQKLEKLNTVGSVLYIAAHPDDENTRLLAYLANERKLRTGYLSLTRGDGGQNLIGSEQGEMLGLIRTQELLAARRTDGAEQFFTRANDFGYSKTSEETFAIWNQDSILADVVWVIRNFRPDVIICRFPTTGEGGHGHHTASALLAVEAWYAAGLSYRFPEQLQYVETWQPKRVFWNTFNFGGANNTPISPDLLKLNVGMFNPLLGKGYGEIAAESRSNHKSQGFGSARGRGELLEYFKLLKGDSVKTDVFEGINQTWARLEGTKKIQKAIDKCIEEYNVQHPEKSVAALTEIYKLIKALEEKNAEIKYWKTQKLKETENLILACAGLWLEATAKDFIAIPGQDITITTQIINYHGANATVNKVNYLGLTDTTLSLDLVPQRKIQNPKEKPMEFVPALHSYTHTEKLWDRMPYSTPYWLAENHTNGLFTVKNRFLIGKAENDAAAKVTFDITINGLNLKVERPVQYKYVDPVKGEVYRPLEILPPATVNIAEKTYLFADTVPKKVLFTVKANMAGTNGILIVNAPENWSVDIKNPEFNLINKGDEAVIEAMVSPMRGAVSNGKITAGVLINNQVYNKSISRVEYDHIPYQFMMDDAEAGLVKTVINKTFTHIGYIPGAGDEVAGNLEQIGYNITMLTDDMLAGEDLSKYPAIVTGIRAYNTNARLQVLYGKLMDYVKNGGNLIVQYNTNSRVGPVPPKIGPYNFTISRDRVTDEKATIIIKNPGHPALNIPNHITGDDFRGWVQERGIYYATDLDSSYTTLFQMADPNDTKPNEGSVIIAKYGKGNFVYTGLAFFRQLPAGVPGAYRLLVNLISLPKNN